MADAAEEGKRLAGHEEYHLARRRLLAAVPRTARPAMEAFLAEWDKIAAGGALWAAERLRWAAVEPGFTAFDPGCNLGVPPTNDIYVLAKNAFGAWDEHRAARRAASQRAVATPVRSVSAWRVSHTARSSVGRRTSSGQRKTRSASSAGGGGGSGDDGSGEPGEPSPALPGGYHGGHLRSLPEVERRLSALLSALEVGR